MADSISPRAQAILDEIERDSTDATALPAFGGHPAMSPAPAPAPSSTPPSNDDQALGSLAEAVLEQVDHALLRIRRLSDAIEDVAGRLGMPLEALVLQEQVEHPAPPLPTAEILTLQGPREAVAPAQQAPLPPAPLTLAPQEVLARSAGPGTAPPAPAEALRAATVHRLPPPSTSAAAASLPPRPRSPAPTRSEAPEADGRQDDASWVSQALNLPDPPADAPLPDRAPAPPPPAVLLTGPPPPAPVQEHVAAQPPSQPGAVEPPSATAADPPPPAPARPRPDDGSPPLITYSTIGTHPSGGSPADAYTLAPSARPAVPAPPVAPAADAPVEPPAVPASLPQADGPSESPGTSGLPPVSVPAPSSSPDKPAFQAPPDYARLVAAEMANAGATRLEVEARLRAAYGIEDPSATLDTVFGHRA